MRYRSESSQHHPHDNYLDICCAAVVSRGRQGQWVESKLSSSPYSFEILRGSVVYILLQNQYIAMLHSSIGIGIGYWYR